MVSIGSGMASPVSISKSNALVNSDYIVIDYDASQDPKKDAETGKDSWTDYKKPTDPCDTIDQNGSFLPVICTKGKIAVRVCGLHFTDVLTVTTSLTGLCRSKGQISVVRREEHPDHNHGARAT
jgi:hypothetical protein